MTYEKLKDMKMTLGIKFPRLLELIDRVSDVPMFDLNELPWNILTESVTSSEVEEFLAVAEPIINLQSAIIADSETDRGLASKGYNMVRISRITNCGNYYVVSRSASKIVENNPGKLGPSTCFCSLYDKKGNLLLPYSVKNRSVFVLDKDNFVMEPQNINEKSIHYRVNDGRAEEVFACDYFCSRYRYNLGKPISAWNNKGLRIITLNGLEYLYSVLEGRILLMDGIWCKLLMKNYVQ